ncbi:glycoside hydrolase family 5 protein, partial [Conidiobolus coronatus NRRL 28638]
LTDAFPYRQTPVRGVNLGGWLVLEPFITPSLFERFDPEDKVIDEWTMCAKLGRDECRKVLEKHYNEFLTEDDIKKIAGAGLNHVRIPLGYWALDIDETKEPFVYGAWYYLLRGIQWARKYGIRVMVEFHGAPGSQNG